MNSAVHAALIDAGAEADKAREAAESVVRYDTDIPEIKASLFPLRGMAGFIPAFVVAIAWRVFG